jgi:hypothetical protein
MSKKPALIWTGGGYGGALPGIPGRDLSAEEVKKHGGEKKLIETGLYEKPKTKKEGD